MGRLIDPSLHRVGLGKLAERVAVRRIEADRGLKLGLGSGNVAGAFQGDTELAMAGR